MQSLSNINKVFLNVPNLEYLNLDVALCSLYVIEDLSSLVEARVSCEVDDDHLLVELEYTIRSFRIKNDVKGFQI
ncbi:hypothetical protein Tco_0482973, partial [Tanacetum coccineum]